MVEQSQKQLLASLKQLLTSGEFSDLIITCGPDTHHVHRNIVCTRSDFFANSLKFTGTEARDHKIDLPEDEPAMVKLLVQYLYEGEYEPLLPGGSSISAGVATSTRRTTHSTSISKKRKTNRDETRGTIITKDLPHTCKAGSDNRTGAVLFCRSPNICPHHICGTHCHYECKEFTCALCATPPGIQAADMLIHSKMYQLGDAYFVTGLKELAREKFRIACASFWNDHLFPVAANHAFSTTPEEDKSLREIVHNTIAKHMTLLKDPSIEALMLEFNGLAFGLLKEKTEENVWK